MNWCWTQVSVGIFDTNVTIIVVAQSEFTEVAIIVLKNKQIKLSSHLHMHLIKSEVNRLTSL